MPALRTLVIASALGAMLVGGFHTFYVRIFTMDRDALRAHLTAVPYRKAPGYREFLQAASAHIPEGERVVFLTRYPTLQGGYRYHFSRAEYVLSHVDLVGAITEGDRPLLPGEWPDAALSWQVDPPHGHVVVWQGNGGSLSRRAR